MGVREERKRRGWSQNRLAALTGIGQADISAIENDRRRPGAGWRQRLAQVFGMSEVELFGERTGQPAAGSR